MVERRGTANTIIREAGFISGRSFRSPDNHVVVLHPQQEGVYPPNYTVVPYHHPPSAEAARFSYKDTMAMVGWNLEAIRHGHTFPISVGIEKEASLHNKKGKFLAVHGGDVTFEDAPPEAYVSLLEVVTDPLIDAEGNKKYPSSATEIAGALTIAVRTGLRIADRRNGLLVFSSVPEGGSPDQLQFTDHPKIHIVRERGLTGVDDDAPKDALIIAARRGLGEIVPIHGTHIHTSNPQFLTGEYDANAAYGMGALSLTQIAEVESFMLFNGTHLMGDRIEDTRDVRSIVRRALQGAQHTALPKDAFTLVSSSIHALEEGETHVLSRAHVRGQHDRTRFIKEFGTTETVNGAANPDLRLDLTHAYFNQLLRLLEYQTLEATGGDETLVLPYLQNFYEGGKYGYLFQVIPTMEGPNSSLQQDSQFNIAGFDAEVNGISYREQMQDMRQIVRNLGRDFPAFRLQATVVDHVFDMATRDPDPELNLADYLDFSTGMKGGIVSDYKSPDVLQNLVDQDQGTRNQVAFLETVGNDEGKLLQFFGIDPQNKG